MIIAEEEGSQGSGKVHQAPPSGALGSSPSAAQQATPDTVRSDAADKRPCPQYQACISFILSRREHQTQHCIHCIRSTDRGTSTLQIVPDLNLAPSMPRTNAFYMHSPLEPVTAHGAVARILSMGERSCLQLGAVGSSKICFVIYQLYKSRAQIETCWKSFCS